LEPPFAVLPSAAAVVALPLAGVSALLMTEKVVPNPWLRDRPGHVLASELPRPCFAGDFTGTWKR
jgi:hypothetical protein